ncbi:MAG: hypothetical protein M1814_001385 [Vezdaea aestivalis]|nr:MAG: hypothetical protein M1814_001385 [Vezdaea aestivalis]
MALMHVEHEIFKREYAVRETMLGDKVSDIPRSNFWVSEDNYPWDMDELVQAISANGGVARNPLTKQLFTADDTKAIIAHSLGKCLAALAVEQSELSKGVRPDTIGHLKMLSGIFLGHDTEDQLESRSAVDKFFVYVATLPEVEQRAIDKLRVPAVDRHTGQQFDCCIGDALRDAQANRICFHKAGDLLRQAVAHLKHH